MKKINKLILFFVIGIISVSYSNAQSWLIAKQAGGAGIYGDAATKIAVDGHGNIYITGGYSGNAIFDTDTINSIDYQGTFFLAKYNSTGNIVWVKNAGGNVPNYINGSYGLKIDSNGNCYVTGVFCGTASFDTIQLTSAGNYDIFIAKYDSTGHCLWAKQAGGSNYDVIDDLVFDSNNSYITGTFNSSIATFDTITLHSNSVLDKMVLAKYNSNGKCLWARTTGGNSESAGYALSSYKDKILLFAGADSGSIFGSIPVSRSGGIIAQYDTSGNCLWIKEVLNIAVNSMYNDSFGNYYATGCFYNSATFDTITLLHSGSNTDCFIVKYDNNGNFKWVRQLQADFAHGYAITTNSIGESYVSGNFSGTAHFGNNTLTSSGALFAVFVAKYDSSGNCIGAIKVDNSTGYGITTDADNFCYVCGTFDSTAYFGTTTLTSYGYGDIFWGKMDAITGIGGIGGRFANNQLLIYANPNAGKCTISIPDEFQNERHLQLSIFDNNGKLLQQLPVEMSEDKIKINLQEEAKGIYNVTLSNGSRSYSGKIVFE